RDGLEWVPGATGGRAQGVVPRVRAKGQAPCSLRDSPDGVQFLTGDGVPDADNRLDRPVWPLLVTGRQEDAPAVVTEPRFHHETQLFLERLRPRRDGRQPFPRGDVPDADVRFVRGGQREQADDARAFRVERVSHPFGHPDDLQLAMSAAVPVVPLEAAQVALARSGQLELEQLADALDVV